VTSAPIPTKLTDELTVEERGVLLAREKGAATFGMFARAIMDRLRSERRNVEPTS
jgi:hypothetical protein